MGQDATQEVAAAILSYIKTRPFNGDSDEDLARWWQGLQSVHPDLDLITEVLEMLVDNGSIEKYFFEDDLFCYR